MPYARLVDAKGSRRKNRHRTDAGGRIGSAGKGEVKHGNNKSLKRIAMKSNILLTIFILNVFLFSGFNINHNDLYSLPDILEQENVKLKRISRSWRSNIWIIITEYEYDSLERISKVSTPKYDVYTKKGKIIGVIDYQIYFYNAENQLEKIKHYGSIPFHGDKLAKEATYKYLYDKDGNKLKEVREYIPAKDTIYYWVNDRKIGYSQNITDSTLYFYDENNRLKRKEVYQGEYGPFVGKLIYSFEYEYEYDNQGNLVEETCYSGKVKAFKHFYQNGLKVKTENFWGKNEIKTETTLFYNKKGNLIYLKSRELSNTSSQMSFDLKYEYY